MVDFDTAAVTAAAGGKLASFGALAPGDPEPLDIDYYAPGKAVVWLVQLDNADGCMSATVYLDRDSDGAWEPTESNTETWDGWIELAAERPDEGWPGWGPILALGFEEGYGVPGEAHSLVRGVAAADVASIEFGVPNHGRRRGVDSPTGAFIIAVPQPLMDISPVLKVTLRGGAVLNLNR